jgi:hypothetical protein
MSLLVMVMVMAEPLVGPAGKSVLKPRTAATTRVKLSRFLISTTS